MRVTVRTYLSIFFILCVLTPASLSWLGCVQKDEDTDHYPDGPDCDDTDPEVHPGLDETCDGKDNNCDGTVDEDQDFVTYFRDLDDDGYGDTGVARESCAGAPEGYAPKDGDCNDYNDQIRPGAAEVCNGLDDNCDHLIDDGFDNDSDDYSVCEKDCDDQDVVTHPEAAETCDEKDNDCDEKVDEDVTTTFYRDRDKDGYGEESTTTTACEAPSGYVDKAGDCDDDEVDVHPEAPEVCDELDNDCDASIDENVQTTFHPDVDGDTYGDDAGSVQECTAPINYVQTGGDCDDDESAIHPGATEVCDGIDQDCDSTVDDGVQLSFYADADADGYGSPEAVVQACSAPDGYLEDSSDCNDASDDFHPGAQELCDSKDNDCDSLVDESKPLWYADTDGDGHGDPDAVTESCTTPAQTVSADDDCDDTTASTYPGATELCDGKDNDCDGTFDNGLDVDQDGYSPCGPLGSVDAQHSDCDDSDPTVSPEADELCDGLDNNCDGAADEGLDVDGDGYTPCGPAGEVDPEQADCDDKNTGISPEGVETCDGKDNDCDTITDEEVQRTWYPDGDGDGYGASTGTVKSCEAPEGYVASSSDCDDATAAIHPGASEQCDSVDNDCDALVDEVGPTWYPDVDGDGCGDKDKGQASCTQPTGFVNNADDCDDTDPNVNRFAVDYPSNGVDDDCDGVEVNVVQLDGGSEHTVAVDDLGRVWTWGSNTYNQLGDGTTVHRDLPYRVSSLESEKIIQVAAGQRSSFALSEKGEVWVWGSVAQGYGGYALPTRYTGLTGIVSIAAGMEHALAADSGGAVWAWGKNDNGQLGDGSGQGSVNPAKIGGPTQVIQVAAGSYHSLALQSYGPVLAWGANNYGQLGDGTQNQRNTPITVGGAATGVRSIAAGAYHSIAWKTSGDLVTWGSNDAGELGNGVTSVSYSATPSKVPDLNNVTSAAGGAFYTLAVAGGKLWSWGFNEGGQLGYGTSDKDEHAVPARVPGVGTATAVATGDGTSFVLEASGVLDSWGYGQLTGTLARATPFAEPVYGIKQLVALSAGTAHGLAVSADGYVYAFGSNVSGALGAPYTVLYSDKPRFVSGLPAAAAVSAGDRFSMALDLTGGLWAWGYDSGGQLGDGSGDSTYSVVQVPISTAVTAVSAGSVHTLAVDDTGAVWGWGDNYTCKVGSSSSSIITTAEKVWLPNGSTKMTAVAAGYDHSLGVDNSGKVWSWGQNNFGQLGNGTLSSNCPTTKANVTAFPTGTILSAVSAGYDYSLALDTTGRVWSWGIGTSGQLGNDAWSSSTTPVQVSQTTGMVNVVGIAAGSTHALAVDEEGVVWAWGENWNGAFGDASIPDSAVPVRIDGIYVDPVAWSDESHASISAGDYFSLFIQDDAEATAVANGTNDYGQLGTGENNFSPAPLYWRP